MADGESVCDFDQHLGIIRNAEYHTCGIKISKQRQWEARKERESTVDRMVNEMLETFMNILCL